MKSNSCQRFIYGSLKQAAGILVLLLLFGGISWLGAINGLARDFLSKVVFWIIVLISGPMPPLLTRFDITNKLLQTLWLVLILPYWGCLGLSTGFIFWKACTSDSDQETSPSKQNLRRMRLAVVPMAFAVGVISMLNWPSSISTSRSVKAAVINNLRQIDGAKQQFALGKKLPADYSPTETELSPYLGRGDGTGIRRIGPERYVLNTVGEAPCAVLDTNWRIQRRGWHEGYTISNGTVFRLP